MRVKVVALGGALALKSIAECWRGDAVRELETHSLGRGRALARRAQERKR